MAPPHVAADPFLQLGKSAGPGRLLEQSVVQVLRAVAAGSANNDSRTVLVPLEDGPWTDAQLSTNLSGDRYLALCGELRMSESHGIEYHGNAEGSTALTGFSSRTLSSA